MFHRLLEGGFEVMEDELLWWKKIYMFKVEIECRLQMKNIHFVMLNVD